MELVDTPDLKSVAEKHTSSILVLGTKTMTPIAIYRLWSRCYLSGYVPAIGGGFCESDDMYRERIKRELGRTL